MGIGKKVGRRVQKVLFLLTSHDVLGSTKRKTGAWLEELAAPYAIFREAGFLAEIASPKGGAAPIDPLSLESPWLTPAGEAFLEDQHARELLSRTMPIRTAALRGTLPDALFLVGGTGTMWDFMSNRDLATLVERALAANRPVAALCHGVIGLHEARATDGSPIVAGRRITCFSNAEERLVGFDEIVPVLAETALVDQGGLYSSAEPFASHVVVDGLLFTGQNPASAGDLAAAVLAFQENAG
jgi:putative intracellular protease/amidase